MKGGLCRRQCHRRSDQECDNDDDGARSDSSGAAEKVMWRCDCGRGVVPAPFDLTTFPEEKKKNISTCPWIVAVEMVPF